MSHVILKQAILFSSTLALILGGVGFASPTHIAADGITPPTATEYCKHKTGTAQSACEQGYNGGLSGTGHQSAVDACNAYPANSSDLRNCQAAYEKASGEDPAAVACSSNNCDFIAKYINPAIDLFSLSFGLIAVISLIVGGIQYSSSQGDPQKTGAAKNRISNTVLAIFAYMFLFVFLQFLIPGGAFH